jgi:hypothetical protein
MAEEEQKPISRRVDLTIPLIKLGYAPPDHPIYKEGYLDRDPAAEGEARSESAAERAGRQTEKTG